MNQLSKRDYPILILVRGLPGSGKTYLANALEKSLISTLGNDSVVTVDPDATDYDSEAYITLTKELTEQGVDPKFHPYRFIRAKAHQGVIDHQIIIWNQPFTSLDGFEKTIANMTGFAAEHDTNLPLLVVEVTIDPATAKQRVDQRKAQGGHGPSEATFARFTGDYVSFADRGYTTVPVDGEAEVTASVASVIQALEQL